MRSKQQAASGEQRRVGAERDAFTITEVLVVISIIVLLIALAVPAFSNLMSSSERSLAENQLKAGLAAARDAAIQSGYGDGAAVFMFNPGGRLSIVACVAVGQIEDLDDPNAPPLPGRNSIRVRDVFVPVAGVEPFQLPRGYMVSAYAPPRTCYDPTNGQAEQWFEVYANGVAAARPVDAPWVTPETGFYDPQTGGPLGQTPPQGLAKTGTTRQSFMVRFKVGTGALDAGNQNSALVFDPIPLSQGATNWRTGAVMGTYRADQLRFPGSSVSAPSAAAWVRRLLADRADPVLNGTAGADRQKNLCALLGDISYDTILVRPVTELALYNQTTLAASIGASSLNRFTNSLYASAPTGTPATQMAPTLDATLFSAGVTQAQVAQRISQWIDGRYPVPGGQPNTYVATDARIFTLQHYLGQIQEVTP